MIQSMQIPCTIISLIHFMYNSIKSLRLAIRPHAHNARMALNGSACQEGASQNPALKGRRTCNVGVCQTRLFYVKLMCGEGKQIWRCELAGNTRNISPLRHIPLTDPLYAFKAMLGTAA